MPVLQLNDLDLFYVVKGEGKPLFLLAGLMSDSQSWVPASDYLAKKYTVVAVDNRCSGRTNPTDIPCTVELMAEDVLKLADYLNIGNFDVVGHSMGGFIALKLASLAPDRIISMVLEATSTKSSENNNILFESWYRALKDSQDLYQWFTEVFKYIFTENVTENEVTLKMFLDYSINYPYIQSKDRFYKQIKAIKDFDGSEMVSNISTRSLVLCADKDLLFSVEESIAAFAALPHKQVSVIEGAAHAMHVEKTDEFVDMVSEFFG